MDIALNSQNKHDGRCLQCSREILDVKIGSESRSNSAACF